MSERRADRIKPFPRLMYGTVSCLGCIMVLVLQCYNHSLNVQISICGHRKDYVFPTAVRHLAFQKYHSYSYTALAGMKASF